MAPTENFNSFSPATEDEIRKLIIKSSDAARLLDPMPIILVKAHIDILFSMITKIVNESLSSGPFPNDMTSLVKPGCKRKIRKPKYYSQSQEDQALFLNYFNSPPICGGTYVEIGALDGIKYSNTKFFEDNLGWGGVLIEAQPENAKKLRRNRSSANNYIISEAVCPDGQHYVNFTGTNAVGGIPDQMTNKHKKHFFSGKRTQTIQRKGYKKSLWNIRGFCLEGRDCTNNQVFEHQNYVYTS
ncbi:hypothetical protein LSH36_2596g00002 [Paralvinella palmiformis]|uniref:Uncharacterized protein n=1 Tax=Paralvinella palmiformis TaxID=53620 RepID=A0AAD9MP59_9ANNE|nr:hypothetical protein LSH36_2596g00002 [Paralvinella palmiformis]